MLILSEEWSTGSTCPSYTIYVDCEVSLLYISHTHILHYWIGQGLSLRHIRQHSKYIPHTWSIYVPALGLHSLTASSHLLLEDPWMGGNGTMLSMVVIARCLLTGKVANI